MSAEGGAAEPKPARKIDLQTILALVNTLLVLGALGVMVYTKLIFERPAIVEEVEIKKVEEEVKKPLPPENHEIVPFDETVINLAPSDGRAHYVTVAFSVETRDRETAAIVKYKKAEFTDKVISALGHSHMTELNSIQGKLLIKTQLLHEMNKLVPNNGSIIDFYFSNFVLQ